MAIEEPYLTCPCSMCEEKRNHLPTEEKITTLTQWLEKNQSVGSKYRREIKGTKVDVYDVLLAFQVTCPARQHAIKKLLCSGLRNKGSVLQDLKEALEAVQRAIQLQEETENAARSKS